MKYVYVLDQEGKPLMPTCRFGKVRRMLTTRNKEIAKLMHDRLASRRASRRGERLARKRLAKKFNTTAKMLLNRILPGCKEPLAVKDIINTEASSCYRCSSRTEPICIHATG